MLLPLASDWKTVGVLLKAQECDLAAIEHNEKKANDCLRTLISWWLKQVDPSPTWKALADALEILDTQIALKIRQQCIHI